MSRGPGRIERAIAHILDSEADNAFTTEDLCERIYGTTTATPQMLRPAFSQYGARSLRLKILPESSRGNDALSSTTFGTL